MESSKLEKIRVRFFTKINEYTVPDTPFAVPLKLGRIGLSEIINHLLGRSNENTSNHSNESEELSPIPFDFLINHEFLRTSLNKYLSKNPQISSENILLIEYMPALNLNDENQQSQELNAWVGAIHVPNQNLYNYITSATYDGKLQLHSNDQLEVIHSISAHDQPIRCLTSFSNPSTDTHSIVTGSKDQSLKIWNVVDQHVSEISNKSFNLHQSHHITGHINSIECVDHWHSSNRQIILSGDWNGNILGWNIPIVSHNDSNSSRLEEEEEKKSISNSSSRKKFKNSFGKSVLPPSFVTEISSPTFTIRAHTQAVSSIQITNSSSSGSGGIAYTCSWDHSLKKWDLETQDCVLTYAASKVFTSIHTLPTAEKELVLSSHPDGKIRLWDTRMQSEVQCRNVFTPSEENRQWISQVRWHPLSENVFVSGDYAGMVRVWDMRASIPLGFMENHDGKVLCLDWLPSATNDDMRVVSGGSDSHIKAFHVN